MNWQPSALTNLPSCSNPSSFKARPAQRLPRSRFANRRLSTIADRLGTVAGVAPKVARLLRNDSGADHRYGNGCGRPWQKAAESPTARGAGVGRTGRTTEPRKLRWSWYGTG